MRLHTMELIAGIATEMYGTKAPAFEGDTRTLGNYAIVEHIRPRDPDGFFAIMVYGHKYYGRMPAWFVVDGFETDDARTMWYAVRASLRRLKHVKA